jgi:hypothetical protein
MGIFGRLIYHKTYGPITLFTIMFTVYSIHYYVIPHTPKQTQIVRPMCHTPVVTQQIITQETPSTLSGQRTPSTSQDTEETLSNHPSYVIQMDSPLNQWN